jgi:NAD-dependent dihydropyrimidine dehydrogenase PreA subunit
MAYVITESCTKDALCVDACPVDCIHPKKDEPGFDCGACVPVCEAAAVFALDEAPQTGTDYAATNAAYYGL